MGYGPWGPKESDTTERLTLLDHRIPFPFCACECYVVCLSVRAQNSHQYSLELKFSPVLCETLLSLVRNLDTRALTAWDTKWANLDESRENEERSL